MISADASSSYDVTSGGNGFCGGESTTLCGHPKTRTSGSSLDCEGTTACNAAPGFDGPSGVGTPNGLGPVQAAAPTAVITPPGSITAGIPASFSAGASSDPYPGGSFSSYSWNWGDGIATSGGASSVHAYSAPGTYVVTLTVTDSYGLTASASIPVTVAPVIVGRAPGRRYPDPGGGRGGQSGRSQLPAHRAATPRRQAREHCARGERIGRRHDQGQLPGR